MTTPEPGDSTPIVGSQTDIAPLGRSGSKPAHELTADEERGAIPWAAIAADADFKKLIASKIRFIAPVTVFFLIYYFALPVLIGWCPDLMKTKVGSVNVAYLFALSQFFMAWIVAGLYVVKAAGWDKTAAELITKFNKR
jgi:uncharacterized membrane protein (DUF485 family)